jgi:uncharacterized membrane protein YheB (UPF0754 family)
VRELLFWLVPPLLGAVIGFITNVVAIKMLFRPLRAIRIFGIRLPFTPGILPRQRQKLADSIGAMVQRELLTPEILKARLRSPALRESLKKSAAGFTEKLLSLPVKEVLANFREPSAAPEHSLRRVVRSLFADFAASPACGELLTVLADSLAESPFIASLTRASPEELLGGEGRQKLTAIVGKFVAEHIGQEHIPRRLLPAAEKEYPRVVEHFIRFLKRKDIHTELETQGRIFLSSAILKLNVFQRFFISAGQYDKTLNEKMPGIIDDLIQQLGELLADEHTRGGILTVALDALDRALSDNAAALSRFAADLAGAQAKRPLSELFGTDSVRALFRSAAAAVHHSLAKNDARAGAPPDGPSFFDILSEKITGAFGDRELGAVLAVTPAGKDAFDTLVTEKLLAFAGERLEAVLNTLDVRAMVRDRINSLDMERVERLILDIMANQLKWIDLFGGILGFLIGLFQVVFTRLVR